MSRPRNSPALFSALRVLAVLLCDAATAGLPAYVLWATGITTVAAGPPLTFLLVVAGTAVLVAVRITLLARCARAARVVVWVSELVLLAGILAAWLSTDVYYLGWQSVYAALVLACGGLFTLLAAIAGRSDQPGSRDALPEAIRSAVGIATGIIVVVWTSPIHEWDAFILNPIVATITVGIALGALLRHLLRRPVEQIEPETAAVREEATRRVG